MITTLMRSLCIADYGQPVEIPNNAAASDAE